MNTVPVQACPHLPPPPFPACERNTLLPPPPSLGLPVSFLPFFCLWGSPFFFFFYVVSYISGVHHFSSSALSALSLGFTIFLLLLRCQLYLWGSPFFFFFCVVSFISGAHPFLLLVRSQQYLCGSSFFFCVPSWVRFLCM